MIALYILLTQHSGFDLENDFDLPDSLLDNMLQLLNTGDLKKVLMIFVMYYMVRVKIGLRL